MGNLCAPESDVPAAKVPAAKVPKTMTNLTNLITIQYCGGCGYEGKARKAQAALSAGLQSTPVKVELIKDVGKTNNFEIVWNGELLHSKNVRDEGFPQQTHLDSIIAKVMETVPAMDLKPAHAATREIKLTQAQVQELGANPEQAKALLNTHFARPAGLVRFAAVHGLDIDDATAKKFF